MLVNRLKPITFRMAPPAFFAVLALIAGACSDKKEAAPKTASAFSAPSTPCGPTQELPRRKPAWIYYNCGKIANIYITPETQDSLTGQPLGYRSVAIGKLSFRYTDLLNKNISSKENFGAFFKAEGEQGKEVNWQWMSYNAGENKIVSRLIIQRFDGTCAPRAFCEQSYITDELQFKSESEVWQWDCQWNKDDMYIICDITKPSDPAFAPIRAWNMMLGEYYSLIYLGIGQSAYQGPYPGYFGTVSDIKLTIFE